MRWERFKNWCRQLVGLPRQPIHYRMKSKGFAFGASPTPEWSWAYFKWLWRSI